MAGTRGYPEHGNRTPAARARRETHWRRVLDRCRASGLTRSAFCQREGIDANALTWWVRVLRERDEARRPAADPKRDRRARPLAAFVPVRVIEAVPAANGASVEVVTRGGRVVRLSAGFDPGLLQRVVAALEDLPC